MLQDPFYKRMQGEAEAVLKRHLKKAHYFRHFNNVGGHHIGAPNLDPKQGPIPGREDLIVQGFDSAWAHDFSVLNSNPQILRASRESNFVKFSLTLIQGKRRLPRGSPLNRHSQIIIPSLVRPELDSSAGLLPMRRKEERPEPMEVRRVKQGRKRNQRKCRAPTEHTLEPSKTSKPKGHRRREDVPRP